LDNVTPNNENNGTHKTGHVTSGFGISDRELAKQDGFQQRLTLAFDWIVANKVIVLLLVGVVAFSSLGYVIYGQVKRGAQMKIQDQYYLIEKDYVKIKSDFDDAERQAQQEAAKATDKNKKDAKKDLESKPEPKKQASGDLDKDYGTVVGRFAELHAANPKLVPGKVAALVLADIYWEYKKLELASQVLEKSLESSPKTLVDYMILKKWSATQLSLGQFDQVIKKNQSVMGSSKYPFMNSYFKLQTGLAYEGLKQWDQAETQYKDVIAKGDAPEMNKPADEEKMKNHFGADQSAAEQAQKYLLLLRMKKTADHAGT
jgi:tetratricopeptide (TPR) repeat protein